MKGLVWGRAGVGSLEMTKPKSVTAGIRQRGQWDIIGFRRVEWELEVQVKKDSMVDGGKMLEFELGGLCSEPFEKGNLIVVEVRSLEDIEVPLALLCISQRVVDMAGNGGLM